MKFTQSHGFRKTVQFFGLLILLLLFLQCSKKNDQEPPPVLPPATTSGAMTFGCKIDGQIFSSLPDHPIAASYEYRTSNFENGWYLYVGLDRQVQSKSRGVFIGTNSLQIAQGENYTLKPISPTGGNAYGGYSTSVDLDVDLFFMEPDDSGTLYITKLDTVNRIISGNFSFTCTGNDGSKVVITEGRFDIRYY